MRPVMDSVLQAMLRRHAAPLMALGTVPLGERLFTISWSLPYCTDPQDGPAYAGLGAPLPYKIFSGTSSGEFFFMPHVYVVDMIVLCAAAFVAFRWLLSKWSSKGCGFVACSLGLVLSLIATSFIVFDAYAGVLRPVQSIVPLGTGRYSEFRPVSVGEPLVECRASRFWFPQGWVHK